MTAEAFNGAEQFKGNLKLAARLHAPSVYHLTQTRQETQPRHGLPVQRAATPQLPPLLR